MPRKQQTAPEEGKAEIIPGTQETQQESAQQQESDQQAEETVDQEAQQDAEQQTAPEEDDDLNLLDDDEDNALSPWEKLKKQPTVRIMVPSTDKQFWEGFLNGHPIMIKTNEYVDVPRDIALLIENNAKVLRDSDEKLTAFQSRAGVKIAEIG